MNKNVINNYNKLSSSLLALPLLMIALIVALLSYMDALNNQSYVQIQKSFFYFLNSKLSQFPGIEYNITQFGDALIIVSFLTILITYTPKVWESLISALLVSVIFSFFLKEIFSIPRPATIFDNNSFSIIGETLKGYSSLPSGHSITTFTVLSVLLFSFIPERIFLRILWVFLIVIVGVIIVSSRVGVGAHHPLDTLIGSVIGFFSGLSGIFISRKYKIWDWVNHKKYYPIFILLILVSIFVLVYKILENPLVIFYFALISLIISLYVITKTYLKK